MAELFQVSKGEKAMVINESQFQDELNDLQPFIKENPQILGEGIQIFDEQVDTGVVGKIDLLALDKTAGTAQVALIELKNEVAEQPVLLQTLRYANWVRNNPDSIKYLLEKKRLSVENVNFNPKIIIVAPQIDPALLELSQYTEAFEFDLIEMKRFGTKDGYFLITDHKTLPEATPSKVRSRQDWNWDRYETELDISKDRLEIGKSLFDSINTICQQKQWSLTPKFNQYYIPFKYGARNVIYIAYWFTRQSCYLGFKLGQKPEQLELSDPYPNADHRFFPDYGEYYVRIDKPDVDISRYIPFMEAAYRNVVKE